MPAQVALAWTVGRGEDVVAIPGTTRRRHLESNLAARSVELTAEDVEALDGLSDRVRGTRYGEAGMRAVQE